MGTLIEMPEYYGTIKQKIGDEIITIRENTLLQYDKESDTYLWLEGYDDLYKLINYLEDNNEEKYFLKTYPSIENSCFVDIETLKLNSKKGGRK